MALDRLNPLARILLPAWAVLLVGALTHPLLHPGELALRDMLVLADPALSPAAVGMGDLPARNAPQDGVLAIVGMLIDASWFARLALIAAGAAAAVGAWWLVVVVRERFGAPVSAWAIAAGMTIAVYNPFVVERLLQGHWSLVIAAWLLPLITAAGLKGRPLIAAVAVVAASLTPTGAIIAAVVAVVTARRHLMRLGLFATGAAASLPWLLPGLADPSAGTSLARSVTAFAPRAEQYVGTPGALVGLGGIWNAEAVPASREAGFALFGVALFLLLLSVWRNVPRRLLVLAGCGLAVAISAWLIPDLLRFIVTTVPGGGLVRDSQKLVMLAIPAYVALAGMLRPAFCALAAALAIAQIPDAPLAVEELRPVEITLDEELIARADGRDTLFLDRDALTRREDGAVIIEPHTKAMSVVESGELFVDGVRTDPPSRRYTAAVDAFHNGDLHRLERLGVGMVVAGDGTVIETAAEPGERTAGIVLTVFWMFLGAGLVLSGWLRRRR